MQNLITIWERQRLSTRTIRLPAEYYKKGLEADPLFAYNLVGQGKLALNGSADKEQAEKVAEKYFKEALKGKNKKDAGLNLAIAKAYYETGTPGYEEYMKKSYKADKKFPDYFMFEGDVLVNQQQYGDACGRYENAIYFDPNCIEAYVKYSHIYFDINPTLAIQKLEELQTIAPNSAIAQREMAEAYYKNSQYTKAAEAYEKYMQNPNHFQTEPSPVGITLLFYGKRFDESWNLQKIFYLMILKTLLFVVSLCTIIMNWGILRPQNRLQSSSWE